MIVVDTTILVYALGEPHPLREPSERLMEAVATGKLHATTTVEVVQELAYVRSRRSPREQAASDARAYARLLSPLLTVGESALERGLALFSKHDRLGSFDAVLAAAALEADADALVSADRAFAGIPGLTYVEAGTEALDGLLS